MIEYFRAGFLESKRMTELYEMQRSYCAESCGGGKMHAGGCRAIQRAIVSRLVLTPPSEVEFGRAKVGV